MISVRVYSILINEQNQILVSDELISGFEITKFCGGGLEQGEGTIDCLKREFIEEMNLKIEVLEHFYTTDFYQSSTFNDKHQVLSIYYTVKALEELRVPIKKTAFEFDENQKLAIEKDGYAQSFRLIPLSEFGESNMTLPIDKIVANLVKSKTKISL